jgi:hypothetical protein
VKKAKNSKNTEEYKPLCGATNRPRGGENPLTTGVKQAVPYRTGREARSLSVPLNKIKSKNHKTGALKFWAFEVFLKASQFSSSQSVIPARGLLKRF